MEFHSSDGRHLCAVCWIDDEWNVYMWTCVSTAFLRFWIVPKHDEEHFPPCVGWAISFSPFATIIAFASCFHRLTFILFRRFYPLDFRASRLLILNFLWQDEEGKDWCRFVVGPEIINELTLNNFLSQFNNFSANWVHLKMEEVAIQSSEWVKVARNHIYHRRIGVNRQDKTTKNSQRRVSEIWIWVPLIEYW